MKLGPVTKLDNRNTSTSKKFDNDVMSVNYDFNVIFLIYGQFRANQTSDSRCMVCDSYIFLNNNPSSCKS